MTLEEALQELRDAWQQERDAGQAFRRARALQLPLLEDASARYDAAQDQAAEAERAAWDAGINLPAAVAAAKAAE